MMRGLMVGVGSVGHLCHELPGALQAGSGVGGAVGQVGLRLQLLRALQRVRAAQQRFAILHGRTSHPPLYL